MHNNPDMVFVCTCVVVKFATPCLSVCLSKNESFFFAAVVVNCDT